MTMHELRIAAVCLTLAAACAVPAAHAAKPPDVPRPRHPALQHRPIEGGRPDARPARTRLRRRLDAAPAGPARPGLRRLLTECGRLARLFKKRAGGRQRSQTRKTNAERECECVCAG